MKKNYANLPLFHANEPGKISIQKSPMLAEVALTYKSQVKASERISVTCSGDGAEILRSIWDDNMEHIEQFVVLLLNRANKVIGWGKVSSGGVTGTVADPKVIFQFAINTNASGIILCHNHPSGNLKPSAQDISLTKKMTEAGKLLDITVLDHVILTAESYYSFADEGAI